MPNRNKTLIAIYNIKTRLFGLNILFLFKYHSKLSASTAIENVYMLFILFNTAHFVKAHLTT